VGACESTSQRAALRSRILPTSGAQCPKENQLSKTTNDRSDIELQDLEPLADVKGGAVLPVLEGNDKGLMSATIDGRRPYGITPETLELVHHG
jgi:hypothetical protein